MTDKKNLPMKKGTSIVTTGKKADGFLAKVRASKAIAPAVAPKRGNSALVKAALAPKTKRPRLVFAIDATASREPAWEAAKATTDALFEAVPGQLDVALAVHGGSELHTFTGFTDKADWLRDMAAGIRCRGGQTRILSILERARDEGGVRVVLYVGDVFEEDAEEASQVADALRLRGIRVIVLHDRHQAPKYDTSAEVFQDVAKRTGGAVLPFDAGSKDKLRQILEAVAALAVGGPQLLRERRHALPGATLLLAYLSGDE